MARSRAKARLNFSAQGQRSGRCRVNRRAERVSRPAREWVTDWMMGRDVPGAFTPEHVRRYLKNRAKIPHTHFSMLNEIYLNLFAPLEDFGVIPPD